MFLDDGYFLCVLGSKSERPLGQVIEKAVPGKALNLCGKTSIDEVSDLIAGFRAMISNDSGLMHVAAAVGIPVTGLYGPTSPQTHPPLAVAREIIWSQAVCSPCMKRVCPWRAHSCIEDIAPEDVYGKAQNLLA